ncbi:AAA family ATPase [Lentibacillus jeotgali]|uniref:AAA family ATPase n=1 Tax=Lentibacillus jeotgali TaxID=558169 RepID=UPI00026283E6|nr:AAA family ATPase [Lentibacillus jeotgali]
MEFADKLLQFKNKRTELLSILKGVYKDLNIRYPFTDKGISIEDICPFTVFGSFNKGITNENRIAIARELSTKFGVQTPVPTEFDGIPVLNNMKAWFFAYKAQRDPNDIPNLWEIFESGIQYAGQQSDDLKNKFIDCYDKVRRQRGVKWNLTMGLYWIRPFNYINLDERNRSYLLQNRSLYSDDITKITKLKSLPDASDYLQLVNYFKNTFQKDYLPHQSFPELSFAAWKESSSKGTGGEKRGEEDSSSSADIVNKKEKRYWIYSPGHGSSKWEEFYSHGIMGLGRDEMGELTQYSTKKEMKTKMKELYGQEFTYMNAAHATWQFANELLPGDTIYAKKGKSRIIGRGIVESEYIYDSTRDEYKHIHKVNWTDAGEWEHPGDAVTKALTDITPYTEYVQKLENLFIDEDDDEIEQLEVDYDSYLEEDFLKEVFLDKSNYDSLVNLLKKKKNVILQGAPGVGKTFAAKRLAYSILGEKDKSRVMMVQFHQSYSYEDFIMGYRPTDDEFELSEGPFYEFCKEAEKDIDRDYFFIIDEINRGNLSKIFGELMMLVEKDKRGQKLRLLYANELFSVPKNVHILGMVNTADRSLAMIDYALRRRFAFYKLEPAFDSDGFQEILSQANNPKFDVLIEQVKSLNNFIRQDESLGSGFQIGHSYFCTDEEVTNEWLSSVIEYELVPLLDEYWFDEPSKVEQWASRLRGALND